MRAPFSVSDLRDFEHRLLCRAEEVVSMREIAAGDSRTGVIGLRHDVDNTFEPCLELARWEADRGYRATYFILHDSPYWDSDGLQSGCDELAYLGHEIGLHTNALTLALLTGRDPFEIIEGALERLRGWGHEVSGVVAHGDPMCYRAGFVNDEVFVECARPNMGAPDRTLSYRGVDVRLVPRSLADFGLDYESYRAGTKEMYLSDSGGEWSEPFDSVCDRFPAAGGQLHILQHPCWWTEAFDPVRVAA